MVRPDVMIFSVFEAIKAFFLHELLAVLNFSRQTTLKQVYKCKKYLSYVKK